MRKIKTNNNYNQDWSHN